MDKNWGKEKKEKTCKVLLFDVVAACVSELGAPRAE